MKLRTLAASALALSLLATACGGDTTDPGSTPPATGTESPAAGGERPEKLVLGLVPSREAGALVESAQPLADAISEAVGIEVEAFVPTDYTALIEAMNTGQADIGAFGPLSLVRAIDRTGAEFIAQSIRFGSATYHTQWMTHVDNADTYCSDEPVTDDEGFLYCNGTLDAEAGPVGEDALSSVTDQTRISFVEQTSTSGFLIPALQLIQAGLSYEAFSPNATYAGGHDASVIAVSNQDAEIGVAFDDARTGVVETNPEVQQNVVVFAYSQEIPNDGFVVRGDLPDDLKQEIADALFAYAETEEGQATLNEIYEIDALQEPDAGALDPVREADQELGELIVE